MAFTSNFASFYFFKNFNAVVVILSSIAIGQFGYGVAGIQGFACQLARHPQWEGF